MEERTVRSKDGQKFVVLQQKNILYVGRPAEFSTVAAQMVVHEAMSPMKLEASKTWINMWTDDDQLCLGVGYKIGMMNAMKSWFYENVLHQEYTGVVEQAADTLCRYVS